MSTTSLPLWPLWVWQTLTGVLAVGGLFLLVWGIRGDRSKGRKRCPRCWYDMSATTGLVCSECGHDAAREKRLFKPRRRPSAVVIGLVALIGSYGTHIGPRVQARGWIAAVPFRCLVWYANRLASKHDPQHPDQAEIKEYLACDTEVHARIWQRDALLWDQRWMVSTFMNAVNLDDAVLVRPVLLADQPVSVHVTLKAPRYLNSHARPEIRTRSGFAFQTTSKLNGDTYGGPHNCTVGGLAILPPPRGQPALLEFDLVFKSGATGDELYSRQITRSVSYIDDIDALLQPVMDDGLHVDARSRVVLAPAKDIPYLPFTTMWSFGDNADAFVTVGLTMDVLRDGESQGQLTQIFPAAPGRTWIGLTLKTEFAFWEQPAFQGANFGDGHWTLRFRGDPLIAYRDPLATHYWKGEFTLPLAGVPGLPANWTAPSGQSSPSGATSKTRPE